MSAQHVSWEMLRRHQHSNETFSLAIFYLMGLPLHLMYVFITIDESVRDITSHAFLSCDPIGSNVSNIASRRA